MNSILLFSQSFVGNAILIAVGSAVVVGIVGLLARLLVFERDADDPQRAPRPRAAKSGSKSAAVE
ncbi:MAG: hypothetical protein JWN71_97 [Xanthobacteraceae bacterium]|jgi:hypothetical protein|nr:hypothetical protein [Xanthobacteraceae bacterium]